MKKVSDGFMGEFFDPDSGKTYGCKLKVTGDKPNVRGFWEWPCLAVRRSGRGGNSQNDGWETIRIFGNTGTGRISQNFGWLTHFVFCRAPLVSCLTRMKHPVAKCAQLTAG